MCGSRSTQLKENTTGEEQIKSASYETERRKLLAERRRKRNVEEEDEVAAKRGEEGEEGLRGVE